MPKQLTALNFDEPFRQKLNERLRASAYGDLKAIAEWSTQAGNPITASSLNRYSMRLRKVDSDMGNVAAKVALKKSAENRKNWRSTKASSSAQRLAEKLEKAQQIASDIARLSASIQGQIGAELHLMAMQICSTCTDNLTKSG